MRLLHSGCLRDHGSQWWICASQSQQVVGAVLLNQNINKTSKSIPSGLYIPLIQQLCSSMLVAAEVNMT